MRISGDLRALDAAQSLVISADPRPFNVLLEDVDKPFLSCSFEDLSDIRAHCELASRKFENILVNVPGPLNADIIRYLTLICKNSASLSLEIDEHCLIKDYRDLFALLIPEEELRYLCLKGKKVGDREWATA